MAAKARRPAPAPDPEGLLCGLAPMHPGELLRDVIIPAVTEDKSEISRRLGFPRPQLYRLLRGETDVSAELAMKLSRLFGSSPEFWMNLQAQFDLGVARAKLGASLDALEPLTRAEAA